MLTQKWSGDKKNYFVLNELPEKSQSD
ncbi:hypothetical protein XBKQ1_2650047 [Xenorhabdus bovienii str. kraussei Quebec]|uniref:Uncharacterized protein n=4 Tax=Xenorhabdus bovienii TaxID=40576 RepID=A0A077PII0_XENBV|nr:hypothetical protein XBFFR1_2370028 [Xenorhabdus bovienii str. feltiae France]CDG97899.1 hypothetical protein XBP1_2880002 [Xenorhabdus bovienii str. puntauvense]CDH00143.1 hypothetical protein XBFM1_1350002 [Xenorhabdus bovienii str. feltiae Moldova]CDH20541.1 hypothetical protein XBKQ1_2650047 [Xenorhabdus bovienii str. kraussei Quebec]CDM90617.1 protein of unknown function [Xenorhabdus bovienii]